MGFTEHSVSAIKTSNCVWGAVKPAVGAASDVEIIEDILFHFILQNHLKLVDRPLVPVTVRALEIVGGKLGQRLNHEPESLK